MELNSVSAIKNPEYRLLERLFYWVRASCKSPFCRQLRSCEGLSPQKDLLIGSLHQLACFCCIPVPSL